MVDIIQTNIHMYVDAEIAAEVADVNIAMAIRPMTHMDIHLYVSREIKLVRYHSQLDVPNLSWIRKVESNSQHIYIGELVNFQ